VPDNYLTVLHMRVDPRLDRIPHYSDASIQKKGLLGGKYVGIGASGSETYLTDGDRIEFTQSALVLENLVNRLFANLASRGQEESDSSSDKSEGNADKDSKQKQEGAE